MFIHICIYMEHKEQEGEIKLNKKKLFLLSYSSDSNASQYDYERHRSISHGLLHTLSVVFLCHSKLLVHILICVCKIILAHWKTLDAHTWYALCLILYTCNFLFCFCCCNWCFDFFVHLFSSFG